MARRQNGKGTIEKLSSGRYRFRIALPNGKRKWSPAFDTYNEAVEMLETSISIIQDLPAIKNIPTLRQWGEIWLEKRNNSNLTSERSYWRNHIETALFVDKPLSEINRMDIRHWLKELERKPALIPVLGGGFTKTNWSISASSRRQVLNLLRCSLGEAVDEELIKVNPAQGLRVQSDPDLDEQWTYLKEDEIQKILDCQAIDISKRLIYQFAIYTGLRQGEIFGLRWEDVYLEKSPHLIVRKSFNGPTKNRKARKVPLFEKALAVLIEFQTRNPQSTEIVFCKKDGKPYADGYDNGWADRTNRGNPYPGHKTLAGISRDVRFHDLRHTCASHLIMGTWGEPWSIYELKDFLGHSSITVTQRYAHLSHEHLQKKASITAMSALDFGPDLVQVGIGQDEDCENGASRVRTCDLRFRRPTL